MDNSLRQIYIDLVKTTERSQELLAQFKTKLMSLSLPEIADAVYVLKKTQELHDTFRLDFQKIEKVLTQIACRTTDFQTIATPWVTATVDVRYHHPDPKPDSEDWVLLCNWLNIPLNSPVSFHWNRLCDVIAARMANGENPPFDMSKLIPEYKMRCLGKKDLFTSEEIKNDRESSK